MIIRLLASLLALSLWIPAGRLGPDPMQVGHHLERYQF